MTNLSNQPTTPNNNLDFLTTENTGLTAEQLATVKAQIAEEQKARAIRKPEEFTGALKDGNPDFKFTGKVFTELTEEEIRNNSARDYNPREWDNTISRYAKYGDVKFYICPKGNGYEYDRFYATYTIEEGITLLNGVSYGACIHNGGFAKVIIDNLGILTSVKGAVYTREFKDTAGNVGRLANDKRSRALMAKMSKEQGTIFTNN